MQQSNDTSHGRAKAANHASYQIFNGVSWSFWFAGVPGNSKHIWSLWEQVSGNNRSWMFSTQTDGTLRCLFSWDGTNFSLHKTATAHCDTSWKHVVFTFNNGVFNCYVNGVLQTLNQTIAWGGGSNRLHNPAIEHIIGGHSPSTPPSDTSPAGAVTNFTIWSKVLSQAEVTELYNSGTPFAPTSHSATANNTNWVRADQTDSGTTLVDQKTSSANMTITTSGTSGVFSKGNNYPRNNTSPGIAAVKTGTSWRYEGDDLTGTYDGSDRWTDPGENLVVAGTQYKANSTSNNKTGTFTTPTAAQIAAEIMATAVEGSYTFKEGQRLMLAAMAGKLSGAPGGPIVIRDINDTKNRITATIDGNGNRTAVTKDVS